MIEPPFFIKLATLLDTATKEYAEISRARENPALEVSTNLPSRSSDFAKAIAWTRKSTLSQILLTSLKKLSIDSS